jgi:tetratricopeptide (TPR) repeat protein
MLKETIELHRQGRLEEAEQGYRAVLAANPADGEALRLLAGLRRQRGDLAEAERLIDAAHTAAPDQAGLLVMLGAIQYEAGKLDESKSSYERALALDPNSAGAHTALGHIAFMRNDHTLAEQYFRTALRVAEDPQALTGLGMVLLARNEAETAIKYFTRAADIAPNDAGVQFSLGRGFMARGMHAFAEQAFLNALRLRPNLPQAVLALGQLYIEAERGAEAEKLMRSLVNVRGFEANAEIGIADALRAQKRLDEAVDAYRIILNRTPDNQTVATVLLWCLGQLNRNEEAIQFVNEQCQRYPDHLGWLEQRARMLTALQRYDLAVHDWQTIVDRAPAHMIAKNHLAQLREWLGENDVALALADEVAQAFPADEQIALLRVRGALRKGEDDKAQALINQIISPNMADNTKRMCSNFLGRIHDKRGDYEPAVQYFKDAQGGMVSMVPSLESLPEDIARILAEPTAEPIAGAPIFLLGVAGSAVEYVAGLLSEQEGLSVLRDRAVNRRGDCFDGRPYEAALSDLSAEEIETLRAEYFASAKAFGAAEGKTLVDWMPHWDAHLLALVKRVFPGSKIILVERDIRDSLLNWLAFGWVPGVALSEFDLGTDWLARANRHVRHGVSANAIPHLVIEPMSVLANPEKAGAELANFIGKSELKRSEKFARPHTLGALDTTFPAGHWKKYEPILADAFGRLIASTVV